MLYEVENKHRAPDPEAIVARLSEFGCVLGPPVRQVDRYFNHPLRDFAQTDEALRIRSVGERNVLTYKGPKIGVATKTRREIEPALGDGAEVAGQLAEILAALGFRPTATVDKSRRSGRFRFDGQEIVAALDRLAALGTFVEIELSADESSLAAAQATLLRLSSRLELGPVERRSYLELVLEAAGA